MTENFSNIEDEPFPSFLTASMSSSRPTLGNMTLGSTLGVPMAASTVAKIRAGAENRVSDIQASYMESGHLSRSNSQLSADEGGKFALSFKDDLDNVDDFIAAQQFSDLLVNVRLEETGSAAAPLAPSLLASSSQAGRPGCADDISTGIITLSHLGGKELLAHKTAALLPVPEDDAAASDGADSDRFSGSVSSFLANEKLMSLDSMNSDSTDDDIEDLQDDELELYFKKLVPPGMQRGHVEGQEIPEAELPGHTSSSYPSSTEPESRYQFLDEFQQDLFHMPHVRLAATGMDSCPASDEDTEDELEAARQRRSGFIPPSISRELVGESNRLSFRPGLEGGSSDDELPARSRIGPPSSGSGIEFRHSAEGQVISSPVTGDGGGGGDGSSGSEENGNDGGQSTFPIPPVYDASRNLTIVGASGGADDNNESLALPGMSRVAGQGHSSEMGDRVGPVGTGEAGAEDDGSEPTKISPVNWSIALDRQEALDAMDSTDSPLTATIQLDSLYLQNGSGQGRTDISTSALHATQSSFHLSQVLLTHGGGGEVDTVGFRGGPCGYSALPDSSGSNSEEEAGVAAIEPKYLSQSFHADDSDDCRNHSPLEEGEVELQREPNSTHSVIYQNEEGKWVTDLAYYSSFGNGMETNLTQDMDEDFVSGCNALDKIQEDQEEFEKQNPFMQEEQVVPPDVTLGLGDTSWKLPTTNYILMRASQASSEYERTNQSYFQLSLGEFFQKRSEALGCLGDNKKDIKRPSFGYCITSPEKREPVALLRPSDLCSRASSIQEGTVQISNADNTMNAEDFDNTLQDIDVETEQQLQVKENKSDPGRSSDSPPSSSNGDIMLSISTIASAIADASISSDPAQLAVMIMELSKKNRRKGQQVTPQQDRLLEALQKSIIAGERSGFDIEKYLRKVDVSSSDSDNSASSYSFANINDLEACVKGKVSSYSSSTPQEVKASTSETSMPGCREKSHIQKTSIPKPKTRVTGTSRRSSGLCVDVERAEPRGSEGGVKTGLVRPQVPSAPTARTSPLPQASQKLAAEIQRNLPSVTECSSTTDPGLNSPPVRTLSTGSSFKGQTTMAAKEEIKDDVQGSLPASSAAMEETHCAFRPSTSPLTHSSPSQSGNPSTMRTSPSKVPPSPAISGCSVDRQMCDQPSPESNHSSLSRLTYVSLSDSTLVNSICLPSPEKGKGNSSLALSTTIVRASPTPPTEQNSSSYEPVQARSVDSCCKPKNSELPGQTQRLVTSEDCSQSRGDHHANSASAIGTYKRLSEPSQRLPVQGDSGYSSNLNIQHPGAPELASQQWPTVSACSRMGVPLSSVNSNELRYGPISNLKPQRALLDLASSVPTLLTGRSLLSTQLAQQYLGSDLSLHPLYSMSAAAPQTVNTVGTAGLPAGYLNPGHLPLNSHQLPLSSGILASGKTYSQHSLEELGMWAAAGVPDLPGDDIIVPEELKFPNACCVGIASQTTLSIFNPTERWVQVGIALTGLTIDGAKVDSLPHHWLIVKDKTIIGPKSTEEQRVLFIPPQPGVYKAVICVSSCPASAESSSVVRAKVFAKRVVLIAVAENPSIEVHTGMASGCLEFGDLVSGSTKVLPLRLINRTHATVPIRLVISASANAWRCFTFSKSAVAMPTEAMLQAGTVASLSAPSVINHVMPAAYGENLETFMVWVHFRAPQKYASVTGELGPADEYSARVDIEVDSPGPSHVIKSIPLKARAGIARVHAPKDMQTVYLVSPFGKSSTQSLPLKNAGNIDVQLQLRSTDKEGCFMVNPEEFVLCVGEEKGVVVTFSPHGNRNYRETTLTILVLPAGPQYEVMLKGEVAPEDTGRCLSQAKVHPVGLVTASAVPPILSNKQFMAWGGVTLGRAVQQKLVLRNNSPSSTQQLRLLIRGQDQDCFQLQSTFGPEERLTRHREISMKPKEDVAVHLLYAPTRVACMLAKLEIKQSSVPSSQPGIKFTIPLSGYGGTSNVILEDTKKLSDSYMVTLGGVAAGRVSKVCLCMRNTGSRAAFVRGVAYADLQTRVVVDAAVISLSPSHFVLKERTQEVVTVLLRSTHREQSLCQSSNALLATICFFCGDEISRQQYRRLLHSKPEAGKKLLSANSLLKNVSFDERFLGEEHVAESCDVPLRPSEAQLFYSNMSKVVLSVMGSVETSDSGESDYVESTRPSPRQASESDSGFGHSDRHISNVSLDVLPVKGPQGPPLALSAPDPGQKRSSGMSIIWSIQPEQLVLNAPTIAGTADTRHVQINNHSSRDLCFELSWPAHCLTITPQHGTIDSESHLQILISPNPSLASKLSILPWSGQIYVQCNGQQKSIKVQIRQDLALDVSSTIVSPKPLTALPPQAETPFSSGCRSVEKPSLTHVEIKNRTLVFPATPSGGSSETCLEVENSGQEVRWYLSSFAPPYIKDVDNSGEVYRATYTAFRCSRVSGILGVKEKMKVPITFLPRDRGDYAQFWDIECHPVVDPQQKSRVRFQLCGTGVKAGGAGVPEKASADSLTITEPAPKAPAVKPTQEEGPRRGVFAPQELYTFPSTRVSHSSTLKVNVRNNSFDTHELRFISPREPFHIKHSNYSLRSQHYINLPVQFRPSAVGTYRGVLLIQSDSIGSLSIHLMGEAVP